MDERSKELVERIRVALKPWEKHISEKRMFGGYCFLYKGKMCAGETKHRLMIRVLSEHMDKVMALPNVKPMDFTGKPLKEFIFVSEAGYDTDEKLQQWIEYGVEHAKSKTEN
jgi:TfoX/Sxy family transcriptional regulator of competence genes